MNKSNAFKKPDKAAIVDAVTVQNPVQTLRVSDPNQVTAINFKMPLDEVKAFKRAAVEENLSMVALFRECFKAWQENTGKKY
jgi:hypothetical protein